MNYQSDHKPEGPNQLFKFSLRSLEKEEKTQRMQRKAEQRTEKVRREKTNNGEN